MTDQTAEFKALKSQRSNRLGTRPNKQSQDSHTNRRFHDQSDNQSPPNTRVIIRGLPVSCTEQKLREHIENKLQSINQSKRPHNTSANQVQLTDVRLMKTAEGRSRQFAFVGFKHLDQAINFKQSFNQTFIGTSKITVDYAYERGNQLIDRPWSKYSENSRLKDSPVVDVVDHKKDAKSKDSSAIQSSKQQKKRGLASLVQSLLPSDKASNLLSDRVFLDYLHAMGGSGRSKFWANDESDEQVSKSINQSMDASELSASEKDAVMSLLKQQTGESDDEDDDAFDNPSIDLLSTSNDQSTDQSTSQANDSDSDSDEDMEEDEPGTASNDKSDKQSDKPADGAVSVDKLPEQSATQAVDPCRLFIRNLPYELTDEEFENIFKPLLNESNNQAITQLHVSRSSDGRCRGFGFASFDSPSTAQSIKQTIDGKIVLGRILRIDIGQARPEGEQKENESFKVKRDRELKAKALTNVNVWNSLFLRPDTVMAAMAAKLGVSKAELLSTGKSNGQNDPSNSLAVRMAVAETSMIDETKAWLVEEGIDVDILEQKAMELSQVGLKQPNKQAKPAAPALARSDRVILVKHTPFESDVNELRRMFAAHGSLVRFVMPPSHSMAIAEFADAFSAKKAFAAIAYTKYKHVPLFLEWAPKAAIKAKPAQSTTSKPSTQSTDSTDKPDVRSLAGLDDSEQTASGTIFVKNLNFTTDDAALRTFVETIAAVRSVTITKKKNSKANIEKGEPATLSMGYGFIELQNASDVTRVINQLNGKELEGHVIQMQPSTRSTATKKAAPKRAASEVEDDADALSSRVIVKNLPFEATLEEVEALFSSRTSVKTVRLPKKIDGRHRGFAFIDFSSRNEAKKAILELSNTHLYGRKLVMQFSKEGEEVEDEQAATEGADETQHRKKKRKRAAH